MISSNNLEKEIQQRGGNRLREGPGIKHHPCLRELELPFRGWNPREQEAQIS